MTARLHITLLLIIITTLLNCFAQTTPSTESSTNKTERDPFKCYDGVFIPKWRPSEDISIGDRTCRAIVYFLSLAYMFLGVSIVADKFMSSIEVITSKEKMVTVTRPGGETVTLSVRIWNETVSNLTLMALGSSAPEIMLSAIEVAGKNFHAGELGPGTIIGSAAFNLFVIISICIYVIPDDEVRRIKHLRVFIVTASWSIFAYFWLYLIVAHISEGVIDIWEGVVTLLLFPITVVTAYITDKKLLPKYSPSKAYRASRHHGVVIETEGETDLEMAAYRPALHSLENGRLGDQLSISDISSYNHGSQVVLADGQTPNDELMQFEQHRREYMQILLDLRKKNPNMETQKLEEMAEYEVLNRGPKSRAFYRIQATRRLTGSGGNVIKKKLEKDRALQEAGEGADLRVTKVHFEPAHYTVMENVGSLPIIVRREGGNLLNTVYVDYVTQDGTATAGSDYHQAEGTLRFGPGETSITFDLEIIDDDIFEEDEHFFVKLSNLRFCESGSKEMLPGSDSAGVKLGTPAVATVMILDDDHAGIFHFEETKHDTFEGVGDCHIKVKRTSGARGQISVPYRTTDGTAKAGVDYEATSGELVFSNDEFEKYIVVKIIDSETYEKNVQFNLTLSDPVSIGTANGGLKIPRDPNDMTEEERVAELGKPRLGEIVNLIVHIGESPEFKKTVDRMMKQSNGGILMGTSSWREQFKEALTVSPGDDDDGVGEISPPEDEKPPSCGDYVMHYVSLPWKILFATVPPTEYCGGWACFVFSIGWIAILTGLIGDLASSIGCTIKLRDSVTAISFVALGTSVPDTFASKVAAVGDKYADSSIGNVTGSNAVNVFLGIGVAWTMAAVVRAFRGEQFTMEAGNLAFSLTVYFIFALSAIFLLLIRRHKAVGGELGGPRKYKIPSSMFLAGLWCAYVIICSLEAYGYIQGF